MNNSEAIPCPVCDLTAEPTATVGAVVICGGCGASLVVDEAGIRRATAADTTLLTADDLHTLRRARSAFVRPERRRR